MAGNLDLSATLELIDRISAPLQSIQSQADRATSAFNRARTAVQNLERQQGQMSSFQNLNNQFQQTTQRLQQAQAHLHTLRSELAGVTTPTAAMTRQLQTAERAVTRLAQTTTNESARLTQLRNTLQSAGINTNNLAQHQQQLATQITQATNAMNRQRTAMASVRNIQQQWQRQRDKLQSVGAGATAFAGAGALAMSVPIKAFAEAEDAAMTLKVSMMDATGGVAPEFVKINELASRLGNTLPGSTADFSNMMAKLVQQGISFKDILGGVGEASANLAVVMKMPFDQAAEFAAKMQDATKTQASDMVALMDTIQKSYYSGMDSTNMLSGFSKLSDGMKTIKMEGLAGAKAMAPLLVMADQAGMAGDSAGNAYSKIFKAMMNTKKVAKSLEGTGIQMDFTNGKGEFGGLDKMFSQLEKLKGLSTEARLPILSDMFGNDAETIQALNLIIDKGKAGYDQTIAKMEAQANLQQRVNAQLGTLTNLWDAAKGTFTSAMASFGEALAPDLKNIVEWIGQLSEKVGTWAQQNPQLAQTLMRIAGIVVIVAAGLAVLSGVMLTVLGPIALLRTAFATITGGAGMFTGLINGIRMLWTGLGMLGSVGVRAIQMLWTGLGMLGSVGVRAVQMLWTGLGMLGSVGVRAVQMLWTGLGMLGSVGVRAVQMLWTGLGMLGSAGVSAFGLLTRALMGIITAIRMVGIAMMANPILAIVGLIAAAALYIWMNWGTLGPKFAALWASITAGASSMWQSIVAGASAMIGYVASIPPRFVAFFTGLIGQMMAIGGQIMEGLKNGIMSRAEAVVAGIQAVASRVKSAFTGMMGIHSPSRVFAGYGDFMMQGLNNGLLANNSPVQSMIKTSDQLRNAIDTSQIRFDSRKPISASMASGSNMAQQAPAPITINVYAQPNQSPQDIAQLVAQELAKAKLGTTQTNNATLYDHPDAW